jgi:beta-alanine--pyruvate transaminase
MKGDDPIIELFHGYTYSGHPLACAAALAVQDIYRDEKLFERAKALEPVWADAIHSLKGLPNVLDIRTIGLVGAVDLASRPDAVGRRAFEAMDRAFHDEGLMMRVTGDTIALSPPLVISEDQIGEIVDKVGRVIKAVA